MKRTNKLNTSKTAKTAIVVNILQIAAVIVFVIFLLVMLKIELQPTVVIVLIICALLSIAGAIIDISDAVETLRREYSMNALLHTNQQMEELNQAMRKQRHDFMNHLQVVYTLIEMQETEEALAYLDRTYVNLNSVSRFLRTQNAAFNALLQAKSGVCEEKGIQFTMDIHSALGELCIPSWEFCSVIGNLIDNAIDAVSEVENPAITIRVNESVQAYLVHVDNNGPVIAENMREEIFTAGFSTKGENHGLGLAIAREIVCQYGAALALEQQEKTSFVVTIPKTNQTIQSVSGD